MNVRARPSSRQWVSAEWEIYKKTHTHTRSGAQFSFPFSTRWFSIASSKRQRHEIHEIRGFVSSAEPNERPHKKAPMNASRTPESGLKEKRTMSGVYTSPVATLPFVHAHATCGILWEVIG